MKFILCAFAFFAIPAWAASSCPVPEEMGPGVWPLPAARQAVTREHGLTILTVGGAQTAGTEAGDRSATYPARLETALTEALPNTRIRVVNEASPDGTTADLPPRLAGLLARTGARLVIWGPGGGDVARRTDPAAFQRSVQTGIDAVRNGGADLILLDAPFVPAPERMARIEPYRRVLSRVTAENRIPLLPRHDMMRHWNDDKTLNLAAREETERQTVARRLFNCLAASLARPIAEAVR